MKKRKINMKNFNNDLSCIFKNRLDKFGISTWKELTEKLNIENPRTFVDFFNGKQCISKEILEKTLIFLQIPTELLNIYTEPVIKYKIKLNKNIKKGVD